MGFASLFSGSPSKHDSDASSLGSAPSSPNGTIQTPLTPATSTFTDIVASPSSPSQLAKLPSSDQATPPPVKPQYDPDHALLDLPPIAYALDLFIQGKMLESEEFCHTNDQAKERLYFSTGYGLIQCVKALMSYEDDDLLDGITHAKHANHVADLHRKTQAFIGFRLAGYVVSSLHTSGVNHIRGMTDVERHAELMYAETLFEKALLGIVYSGDWLAFIKEALNMRTTVGIYRHLGQYLDAMDADAVANGLGPTDPSIDAHFRSGVYLGVGMCNIVLSLMPGKLATLVELFGYKGDRKLGLEMLMKAGGWVKGEDEPRVSAAQEGLRRPICDMALLIFHLVVSAFTFEGVDVDIAEKVLQWNLKRFPNAVFFLFGAGRLALCRAQPERAIDYYTQAMDSQNQYRNLHHISYWEIAVANLALWDLRASLKYWRELEAEATWSKAIYSYGMAVCLLELSGDDEKKTDEAAKLMDKVPGLRQKVAGKSIPFEKLVARKARKFQMQGNRLALPALELAYLFHGLAHARRPVIATKMLPEIDKVLAELARLGSRDDGEKEASYRAGRGGYWDDYCLAMLLKGVCMRYVAYPDPDADVDPKERVPISKDEAERASKESFHAVFQHGPKIQLDHHLVYYAHYEFGRLLARQGALEAARHQYSLVLSGKPLEVGASGKKGRYSMENALHIKTHAAMDNLHSVERR